MSEVNSSAGKLTTKNFKFNVPIRSDTHWFYTRESHRNPERRQERTGPIAVPSNRRLNRADAASPDNIWEGIARRDDVVVPDVVLIWRCTSPLGAGQHPDRQSVSSSWESGNSSGEWVTVTVVGLEKIAEINIKYWTTRGLVEAAGFGVASRQTDCWQRQTNWLSLARSSLSLTVLLPAGIDAFLAAKSSWNKKGCWIVFYWNGPARYCVSYVFQMKR